MTDDTNQRWDEDPGWPVTWRALLFLVPGAMQRQAKSARGDGLLLLRYLYTSFVVSIVLFGVVLPLVPTPQQGPVTPWLLAIFAIAAISVLLSGMLERPLNCASDLTLNTSFRTRLFTRLAFAEPPALFAFVFSFVNGPMWIFYVGAAITLTRMAMQAPTPAALVRDQDELSANGCSRSLVAALRHPRPG